MDKRYQVFVSSTYADLQQERQKVIQTLMEMDCIPAGMEIFPAVDEEQWEFIKKIIDDCDYYLLIIGGRYGSTTEEGLSYTEKEYEYAIEIGIKVIALLHADPDTIPAGKTDQNQKLAKALIRFRDRVSKNRLVKFWDTAEQLPGIVALSLQKTIKTYPAVGWIRGDTAASNELLNEVNELQKKNQELTRTILELRNENMVEIPNLAGLDQSFGLHGDYIDSRSGRTNPWRVSLSWGKIFRLISPYLMEHPSDSLVQKKLRFYAAQAAGKSERDFTLGNEVFQTVKVQLMALGLVDITYSKTIKGDRALFWSLTKKGKSLMIQLRTEKTAEPVTLGTITNSS